MPANSKKARPSTRRTTRKRRSTQAERTALSHAELMRAALALVAERGIRATSLQAIGERAGYSRGLVGHRFGSKEGLFRELVVEAIGQWRAALVRTLDDQASGTEALKATARTQRETIETSPEIIRVYYMLLLESVVEMPELRGELVRIDAGYRALFDRLLRDRMEKGTLRSDLDPRAHGHLFLAMLRGIALQWVLDPENTDVRELGAALDVWIESTFSPRPKRRP
jgi:AcrR family transcriptional regulator